MWFKKEGKIWSQGKKSIEIKEKKSEKSGTEKEQKRKRTEPNESEEREKSGHKDETKLGQSHDDQMMETEPKRKQHYTDHRSHHKKPKFASLSEVILNSCKIEDFLNFNLAFLFTFTNYLL